MREQVDKADRIERFIQGQRQDMLDTLETLVTFETPSKRPAKQKQILTYLQRNLDKLEFYTFYQPGSKTGGYLYSRPKNRLKSRPVQLLVGHADTVWEENTLNNMPYEEKDTKVSGPGVFDMKAGLTQIIYALKTLKELKLQASLTPVILINTDEETGSNESTHAIARLARIANRAFILEPPLGPEGHLKTQRKGVGRFTLTVEGKAAHAGLDPESGANAIVELSHQIRQLYDLNDPEKGITVNIGMISGGVSANVVAPESSAVIDVRVNDKKDGEEITRKIKSLQPHFRGTKLIIEGGIGRQPMTATERNQSLWKAAREKGDLLGMDLKQGKAGGGSDGNTTSLYTATLDGLGTPGDGAHAPHEYIHKSDLVKRTALLTLLLLEPPLNRKS
ncbi:M20 family metallopeptidase [Robertkochia aurantiaca]|uniref:M20 family metallopeptidase n=1 Tax=Robertkochia aurantiaca TaxID=2873700 RepID=UPI001CCA3EF6|nr:M20 family metallopeptidase [Robertkochia sp. 3YJGBD-33]